MKKMNSFQLAFLSKEEKLHNPIPVKDVRYKTSLKQRVCEYCGCEIHKGELYYSYKPIFSKRVARCMDHKPKIYNDVSEIDLMYNSL